MIESRLTFDFASRMIGDLAENTTLRGAWAEQLVAYHLGIDGWPGQWCYYDMEDAAGREISVKHSVGPKATFSLEPKASAWDPRLRAAGEYEGWWETGGEAQHWCDVFVFVWLSSRTSLPDVDEVLDPGRWQYGVLSRADLYRKLPGAKSAGINTIRTAAGGLVSGDELAARVAEITRSDESEQPDVPRRIMTPYVGIAKGPPLILLVAEPAVEPHANGGPQAEILN